MNNYYSRAEIARFFGVMLLIPMLLGGCGHGNSNKQTEQTSTPTASRNDECEAEGEGQDAPGHLVSSTLTWPLAGSTTA